jgi:hypothetical protein
LGPKTPFLHIFSVTDSTGTGVTDTLTAWRLHGVESTRSATADPRLDGTAKLARRGFSRRPATWRFERRSVHSILTGGISVQTEFNAYKQTDGTVCLPNPLMP